MKKGYIKIIIGGVIVAIVLALSLPSKNSKEQNVASGSFSLKEVENVFDSGDLLKARNLYQEAGEKTGDFKKLKKIQERLEEINIKLIFSSIIDEYSTNYIVKYGDALERIAKKFGTTVNLIKKANNLPSDIIRPNQKLKISTCKFSIVVDKSQNLLFLKRGGEVIKTYIVSTGKDNSTPTGVFHIANDKLIKPTWYKTGAIIPPDSPDNVLGARWMGLKGIDNGGVEIEGYGIHGTTKPNELGKQITLGCVRMKNEDVEALFDIVPVGSEVIIID
ncbi:MAG: L,D-transpeptidase family protein [Candidatus Susulua stagnicola]|nr:L,D-transpeptidase family protein [Candidatus Susulua stagnicola]